MDGGARGRSPAHGSSSDAIISNPSRPSSTRSKESSVRICLSADEELRVAAASVPRRPPSGRRPQGTVGARARFNNTSVRTATFSAISGISGAVHGIEHELTDSRAASAIKVASHWMDRFVIREDFKFRRIWDLLLAIMLVYIGTVFTYGLSFIAFRVGGDTDVPFWYDVIDNLVGYFFWVDFVLGFFVSYRDKRGKEVVNLYRIVFNYLRTHFIINLVACLPPEVVSWLVVALSNSDAGGPESINEASRLARIPRISRMARLFRLLRLGKLVNFVQNNSWFLALQGMRGVRLVNLVFGLGFMCHLLACGWYICASLHEDASQTWLYRRIVDDHPITYLPPAIQWCHSMYFVLTVCTTTGFGDIYAVTVGEMWYAIFTMMAGAVIESVIVTQMIGLVTNLDDRAENRSRLQNLFTQFGSHCELKQDLVEVLANTVENLEHESRACTFDRAEVWRLFSSFSMPSEYLPTDIMNGLLKRNRFFNSCLLWLPDGKFPERFPLFVALSLTTQQFYTHEYVYHKHELPVHIYLVQSGTFSYVMEAAKNVATSSSIEKEFPIALRSYGSYFGEVEVFNNLPRSNAAVCQAEGSTLTLSKDFLRKLTVEFPAIEKIWVSIARRRSSKLCHRKAHGFGCMPYQDLAATTIQSFMRYCWRSQEHGWARRWTTRISSTADEAFFSLVQAVEPQESEDFDLDKVVYANELLRSASKVSGVPTRQSELSALRSDVVALKDDVRQTLMSMQLLAQMRPDGSFPV